MSNRNFDFSAIVKILNAQNNANYYNRQQTVVQAQTSGIPYTTELQQFNPQTGNYDADTIATLQAGQQAYYFKGLPITTVLAPQQFTTNNETGSVPGPPTNVQAIKFSPGITFSASITWDAPINGPVTSYRVVSSPAFVDATTASTSYTASGFTTGTSYTFVVYAINSAGSSVASDPSAPVS